MFIKSDASGKSSKSLLYKTFEQMQPKMTTNKSP